MNELENLISVIRKNKITWSEFKDLIKNVEFDDFLNYTYNIKKLNFGNLLKIYVPNKKFPAISVTGTECALNCEHCNKKYLEGMTSIQNAEDLKKFLMDLYKKDGTGALISGGCDPEGAVPLNKYLKVIKEIKSETDLIINSHTGLPKKKIIDSLIESQVDIISFDVNLDEEVIKDIYHLDKDISEYEKAIESLSKSNLNVVPHICVGLNYGKINKEIDSIRFIKEKFENLSLIVIIILIPPKSSEFETPDPEEVAKIIGLCRIIFPETEISLGCMRPRGMIKSEIEKLAIKAGITRIEIPSNKTLKWLKSYDPKVFFQFFSACCAIPPKYEKIAKTNVEDLKFYRNYI